MLLPLFANLKHTQTHIHIHTQTYAHTSTHKHTHTHTHAHTRLARYTLRLRLLRSLTNPKNQILETRTERIMNISVDYIVNLYSTKGWDG